MRKTKNIVFSICSLLIILLIIALWDKEPICDLVGVVKLEFSTEDIVKISNRKYMLKSRESYKPFIKFMENKNWHYIEQVGSGLVFEKDGLKITVSSKMFTRRYIVITYDGEL
ncbi:MAG TPA: hypothetical protein DEG06_01765 [Lachnospiraceae bacterium]|jgi:hypothetical protein|nr:hypothetical protein [Lachnospiraceae bacterium]HBI72628.1 hypothetical protein [Lachnospiraceae bacterium]HBY70944.1 hypothetical protein [Lachnospiraceae bacterium]HCA69754.1 hypothetical protein [Lachnospiraceae bacterium]HCM12887.1 hypothetical protein [Lachnospiraceae bacterium]